jgi:hypothetical protein
MLIWIATVGGQKISAWKLIEDTPDNRRAWLLL